MVEVQLPSWTLVLWGLAVVDSEDDGVCLNGHHAHFIDEHFGVEKNGTAAVGPHISCVSF